MPGYDKSRFVNLSEPLNDELTCGICLGILKNAIVVPCCRHTYCYNCIIKWLNNNTSCPNDRTKLIRSQLYHPQRLVLNLLAKLRIHCDFHSKGCDRVLDLECLPMHAMNCEFNPERKCIECGLKMDSESHNCVNDFKLLNSSLNNQIIELKNEIERLNKNIESMKDNHLQYDHMSQVIASARRTISYPQIIYCSIPSTIRIKAIDKSREAIQSFDSYLEISRFLNSEFNGDYNLKWYAIAHAINCGESIVVNENGYIDLRFGELRIALFSAGTKSTSLTQNAFAMDSTNNNV